MEVLVELFNWRVLRRSDLSIGSCAVTRFLGGRIM